MSRSLPQWLLATLGASLLAIVPQIPIVLWSTLGSQNLNQDWPMHFLLGTVIGMAWGQWSIITAVSLLHWGSIPRRVLLYLFLAGPSGVLLWLVVQFIVQPFPILFLAHCAPLIALIITAPTLLMKMYRRWTLAPRVNDAPLGTTSLLGLFLLTAVCAVAVATIRFVQRRADYWLSDDWWLLLSVFGVPLASVGILQLMLIPRVMLRQSDTGSIAVHVRLLLEFMVLGIGTVITALLCWGFSNSLLRGGGMPSLGHYIAVASLEMGIVASSGVTVLMVLLWLRMMGYELRGHKEQANAVHFKQALKFNQIVAKHIDPRKFFGWFVGLALPFTIAMSYFTRWHNDLVVQAQPAHLLLRCGIFFVGMSIVFSVVYCTAVRPALKKAQEEVERMD